MLENCCWEMSRFDVDIKGEYSDYLDIQTRFSNEILNMI